MDDVGQRLYELREQTAQRVASTRGMLLALTHDRVGSNDDDEHDPEGVPLSSEWSRLTGLVEAAEAELAQVAEAIQWWERGDYGLCAQCGHPIPAERLEVRPFATHCVACAVRLGL